MTPEERAQALVEAQGDDLTRYQRMFLAQDIAAAIKEAVNDAVKAERSACVMEVLNISQKFNASAPDMMPDVRYAFDRFFTTIGLMILHRDEDE